MSNILLGITMKQIFAFMAATKYGSFTSAAEYLFTSQTSVSRSISELERHLEVQLFERYSNGVTPTPEGKALFMEWLPQIEKMEDSVEKIRKFTSEKSHSITIADFDVIPSEIYMLPMMKAFNRKNTNIELQVQKLRLPDILEGILLKKFDAAFVSNPGLYALEHSGYEIIKAADVPAQVLLSKDNPILNKKNPDVRELSEQTLVILRRQNAERHDAILHEIIKDIAKRNGIIINKTEYADDTHSLVFRLLCGNYWSILSRQYNADLRYIPLKDHFVNYLGLNNQNNSPEMKYFSNFAKRYFNG